MRSHSTHDRALVCLAAAARAAAAALAGVLLGVHLAALGWDPGRIGLLVSTGLGGAALGALAAMAVADRAGRRATLVAIGVLLAVGGLAFARSTTPGVLFAAALLGMVNGMGRDRGAGLTLDQTLLPQTASPERRTLAFAWYNVAVDAGHAGGALLGGLPALLRARGGFEPQAAYQATWGVYAGLGLVSGLLALGLSPAVEPRARRLRVALSPASRRVVQRFAGLSALDSLGGGFLTSALIGYWFLRRFGADEALLGPLFAAARVLNGFSHLGAAWLARRIGLVNTMVWTHVPSSLLLATVAWAPNLGVAVVLFLVREALVEMDVPTRQSYLAAIVHEDERLAAAGITNLTRGACWAVAPGVAGFCMRWLGAASPLVVGPALKVTYDLLLWRAFRHLRPPEERAGA